MILCRVALAAAALLAAPAWGGDAPLPLPDRLGPLTRVAAASPAIAASYTELPAGPGQPIADVYVRRLGRTPVEDMAAAEAPLRALAGVTAPGEAIAAPPRCPGLVGRIDAGRVGGADTVTGSLFAVRGGMNVKLRITAPAARGAGYVRAVAVAFGVAVLGC